MSKELKLPEVGEGIKDGDVVNVLVAEGDTVAAGQTVLEIETEKAVLEVPCTLSGKVLQVHVNKGDKIRVGATLLTIDTDVSAAGPAAPAPAAQVVTETSQPPPVAQAEKSKQATAPASPAPKRTETAAQPADEPIPAGPATRRLARELGLDLAAVAAANPGQRLTAEHIKAFVRGLAQGSAAPGAPAAVQVPPLPDFGKWGPIQRVPFTSLQRKTAEHLHLGWSLAPHVTQFDLADITELEELRKRFQQTEHGRAIRLTVTAFVLKATAAALKLFPQFNASLDMQSNELVLKRYYHLGVAVDTEGGLIVPVLRDADQKSVLQIAAEMNDLAERTRQRKITLEELRGGTFTVTNLGGIGGTAFTPVLNYPEVAILGLARGRAEPAVRDGQLTARLLLPLCLSYDHRVIYGADGARFVRKLADLLEDPEILLLEG